MTGRELYGRYRAHYADSGIGCKPWEDLPAVDRHTWELLAEGVVDRRELEGAYDRIGGLPDRDTESPETFTERVEAGDAWRIAFDVALILTEDS